MEFELRQIASKDKKYKRLAGESLSKDWFSDLNLSTKLMVDYRAIVKTQAKNFTLSRNQRRFVSFPSR